MKKILSILLALSLSTSAFADFEGFPCATNNIWQQVRSFGGISQLWESVAERCMVLTNRSGVYPLNIEEDWVVQDGYSNEVVSLTFGTNVVVVTNRYPHFITIPTTNQVCDLTITISNQSYGGWFVPLSTNNIQPTTNVQISFPVTHDFISTLDARMFQITPYFVNTNRSSHGNFDAYFTLYGTAVYSNYVDGLVPTEWPYHCIAGVMKEAGVGYITNLVYDSFSNVINGSAWFTRQPAVTNAWALWQAVRVAEDSVLVSGMTDAAVNGTYVKMVAGDGRLDGWWPTSSDSRYPVDPTLTAIYIKLDRTSVITRRGTVYSGNSGPAVGPYYLWSIDKLQQPANPSSYTVYNLLQYGWNNKVRDVAEFSNIEVGTNTSAFSRNDEGDFWEETTNKWNILSSTLITSNNWRNIPRRIIFPTYLSTWASPVNSGVFPLIGWDYWTADIYGGFYSSSDTYDNWSNHPAINGASVVATLTSNWICRPLANYDVRYYDEGPRPFYQVLINGSNAYSMNLNVNIGGTAFIRLNEPDFMGEQVVMYTNEVLTLTASNTPSSYRWFSIESVTNTYVTGEAPIGSVITLMWTNSHTFDHLPYRLEAKDLDERWKYLRQLIWTTVPYEWVDTMEGLLVSSQESSTNVNVRAGGWLTIWGEWLDYNFWNTKTEWETYRDTFISGVRTGWNQGDFAGYLDPMYPVAVYSNYFVFANLTYTNPAISSLAPTVQGAAHSYFTKESKAIWRGKVWPWGDIQYITYPCEDVCYQPGYRGWFQPISYGFNFLEWLYPLESWFYDMTSVKPVYEPNTGTGESGIGYLGPEDLDCRDGPSWYYNYVTKDAGPGVPYYEVDAEQACNLAGCASKVAPQHLNNEPLFGNRLTFEAQVYIGVFAADVYEPWHMFEAQINLVAAYTTAAPYSITISNMVPSLPNNEYISEQYQEQVVWKFTMPTNLYGAIWNTYSQEVSRLLLPNRIVVTTNDVVIRWFHLPEIYSDPYVFESNTYYSAANIPQFCWSNGAMLVEYTTNIFDIPYNPVVGWTNYPGVYPSFWGLQPATLVDGTEYEYATITNVTTYDVVSYTTVVWSGFNEWSSVATITEDGFGWTSSGSAITIVSYTANGPANVVIPATINGLPVTAISGNAFAGNTAITSVSGGGNITSLPNNAFINCTSLTSVSLPSVTSVGDGAFYFCTSLTSVSLSSVTSVGNYAFRYCVSLISISLPSVTSVGDYAFINCTSLTSVSLPSAISVGNNAFINCTSLTSVSFSQNAPAEGLDVYFNAPNVINYVSSFEATGWSLTWNSRPVIFRTDNFGAVIDWGTSEATLDWFSHGIDSVIIPSTVNGYPIVSVSNVFANSSIISISGSSIQNIPNGAFSNCISLGSVDFPATINVGYNSFMFCTNLSTISLPNAVNIGEQAFYGNSALATIFLPATTNIGDRALAYCGVLGSIALASATDIGVEAFYYCTNLADINIPVATNVADGAFSECPLLASVSMAQNVLPENTDVYYNSPAVTNYIVSSDATGWGDFWNGRPVIMAIPYWTIVIEGDHAVITGYSGGTDVVVPDMYAGRPITSFGVVFQGTNITSVSGGANITNIDEYAFYNCVDLMSVSLPLVTNIEAAAFLHCSSLNSITFPSLVNLEETVFAGCSALTSFDIAVTNIGQGAFALSGIMDINLPSVISVGHGAFQVCTNLTFVSLTNVVIIEYDTFRVCTSLVSVDLPKVTQINVDPSDEFDEGGAFRGCTSLGDISLPSITNIGNNSFNGCTALTNLSLPKVEYIGRYGFSGCPIKDISLTNLLDTGGSAFKFCHSLTNVYFPSITNLASRILEGCGILMSVSMNNALSVGDYAFSGTVVSNVSLSSAIYIGIEAFSQTRIVDVDLPSAKYLGMSSFYYCRLLKNINIPLVETLDMYAFAECPLLEVIDLPSVTIVNDGAFITCDTLNSVTFYHDAPTEVVGEEVTGVFAGSPNVTNYVANPDALGWGETWNGRPVVFLPFYGRSMRMGMAFGTGAPQTYQGTGGWVHTTTNDVLSWDGFYDYTSASNRLVELGLDSYIPNLQYKTIAYTQTVYNVTNLCTLTVIPVGERKVIGSRDCYREDSSQVQIHNTNFSFTATAPECLIKWNFKRK